MTPEHWALLRTKHAPPLRVHPILRTQLELRTPWPLFEWQQRLSLILGVRVGTHLGGPGGLRINASQVVSHFSSSLSHPCPFSLSVEGFDFISYMF